MIDSKIMNRWKSQSDSFSTAISYMRDRKSGLITSFKTPWTRINDATTDGLEWGSTTIIAGRPGSGKTMLKDQLVREGIKINCTPEQYKNNDYPFRILEFSLEMVGRVSAIREFSAHVGKNYKELCSAGGELESSDLDKCIEYSTKRINYPIDMIEESPTVSELVLLVSKYMEEHSTINSKGDIQYKNTVITLDHSILIKRTRGENRIDMLYNLGDALTSLKRKYPIAFVILSQLNRDSENPKRSEPGTIGNYILESDIFGADALLQHADVVFGLNRPYKNYIKFYGPDRYVIEDENTVVAHFLKCRNGDTRMSFFKGHFSTMSFQEIEPPGIRVPTSK